MRYKEINEEALKRSTLRYLNPAHSICIPHDAVLHIDNPPGYSCQRKNTTSAGCLSTSNGEIKNETNQE